MDHKSAVAGQMLRHLAEGRESDKRYRVTVEFAHDVRHEFIATREVIDNMKRWLNQNDEPWITLQAGRVTYVFNRDYLCSMVVEEVSDG